MKIKEKTIKHLHLVMKIFFVGLLLQFFLNTFVSFQLGLQWGAWSAIWMRKEGILLGLLVLLVWWLHKQNHLKIFWKQFPLRKFAWVFGIAIVVIFAISLLITHAWLWVIIMSLKYTFAWFLIFLLFFAVSWLFLDAQNSDVTQWYVRILKLLLIWGILRRIVIWLVPSLLEFGGYNKFVYEWDVGIRPPAAYYTQITHGYVRNQFLFERPISRGFFLIAFWPLFFASVIKNRWPKNIAIRWWLYGLNIFSTFSRAAWWARIVLTVILVLLQYKKQFWRLIIYLFIPLFLLFGGVTLVWKKNIIDRDFSNTWHIQMVITAIQKIKEKPMWWQGAGTAWPVTHHYEDIKEYNPENQFLQIWIEYGVLWFGAWLFLYFWMMGRSVFAYQKIHSKKATKIQKQHAWIVMAFGLGLFGLAIEWLVLHSFVDRMIVYPFMALFGISYATYLKTLPSNKHKSLD